MLTPVASSIQVFTANFQEPMCCTFTFFLFYLNFMNNKLPNSSIFLILKSLGKAICFPCMIIQINNTQSLTKYSFAHELQKIPVIQCILCKLRSCTANEVGMIYTKSFMWFLYSRNKVLHPSVFYSPLFHFLIISLVSIFTLSFLIQKKIEQFCHLTNMFTKQ